MTPGQLVPRPVELVAADFKNELSMDALQNRLETALHSRNPFVRKASALVLQGPKFVGRFGVELATFRHNPPVLANSFPKSGTHLLDQMVAGLPGRVNYGAFLSSMTSSFQYRLRTSQGTQRFIGRSLPGEIVRAHLYYAPEYEQALQALNFVHYFIYRDPRDVVVSSSHYLRHMNRWHRLSRRLRDLPTDADGILANIVGFDGGGPESSFPSIAVRFAFYEGWLSSPNVYAVRYEDLVGADRDAKIIEMTELYARRASEPIDVNQAAAVIRTKIAPEKSHTFRKGKRGGWQNSFTPELTEAFKRIAGELLIRLGYEQDENW